MSSLPGKNEEVPRLLAHSYVDVRLHGDVLGAVRVRALAQEDGLVRRDAVAFLQARDVLVDFAKKRLVAGGPLLPERRHDDHGER